MRSRCSVTRNSGRPVISAPPTLATSPSSWRSKTTSVRVRNASKVSDKLGTAVRLSPRSDLPQYLARAMFAQASARPMLPDCLLCSAVISGVLSYGGGKGWNIMIVQDVPDGGLLFEVGGQCDNTTATTSAR